MFKTCLDVNKMCSKNYIVGSKLKQPKFGKTSPEDFLEKPSEIKVGKNFFQAFFVFSAGRLSVGKSHHRSLI